MAGRPKRAGALRLRLRFGVDGRGKPWRERGLGHCAHLPYDPFMSSTAQDALTDENARYKRVVRTAEELFKKVGFRAVTMELVAREANVAKATLYSYFKN